MAAMRALPSLIDLQWPHAGALISLPTPFAPNSGAFPSLDESNVIGWDFRHALG
jgi:hypothetical protein